MIFSKEHKIKLSNSEQEYKLTIKIEKEGGNNDIEFHLNNNQNLNNEYFYMKINLEELKILNSFFRLFNSNVDCANAISNIIKNSNPKLLIEEKGASLYLKVFVSGIEKENEIKFFLEKKKYDSNMNFNVLLEEINKLKTKINDLEILVNKKDQIINEIQKNYEELKNQHQTDIINLRSLIPNQNNNENPYVKSYEEQIKINNNEQSTIVDNNLELNLLGNQFRLIYPGKNVIYNLLYRKSRDSDKASVFHSKCDKIRGTIVIIKTIEGLKFGGYTNETWEGNNISKKDNTAFIFSLNYNKVYKIKKNMNAIFCSPNFGPFFGGKNASTLIVYDNSDANGGECCISKNSNYDEYIYDYEINRGKRQFKISDIEVFKVSIV